MSKAESNLSGDARMAKSQIDAFGIVMLLCAAPVWIFLSMTVPRGTGFGGASDRYVIAPIVLSGITISVHRLIRDYRNAWPLSALISGVGVLVFLFGLWIIS